MRAGLASASVGRQAAIRPGAGKAADAAAQVIQGRRVELPLTAWRGVFAGPGRPAAAAMRAPPAKSGGAEHPLRAMTETRPRLVQPEAWHAAVHQTAVG